jgi:hypothetical protein
MPLEEAKLKELTQEHQPSLIASSQRIVNSAASKQNDKLPHPRAQHVSSQDVRNKTITRQFARGFVKCGDCAKPRVIYSETAPRRMVPSIVDGRIPTFEEETACQALAEETLKEACTSLTFVCGAMLYDTGHPFKDVFITQPTLACADHVEPFFYSLGARARCGLSDKLCCFCAEGEADGPDEELQKMFTTVLPVCSACLSKGAKIPVRHAIRNSSQRASRAAIQAQRKAKRDARAVATEVHPPQEDVEEGIAPEALEVPREEVELTASTSRRGRGRGRGHVARGRSGLGRS